MPRWSPDATEFVVGVSFIPTAGSSYGCIPKPILAKLGNPKSIKYTIHNDQITVSRTDS